MPDGESIEEGAILRYAESWYARETERIRAEMAAVSNREIEEGLRWMQLPTEEPDPNDPLELNREDPLDLFLQEILGES